MKSLKTIKRSKELSKVLSFPALDGNIPMLVGSGLLTLKTAPLFTISIIAGPASLVVAANLGGTIKENVIAALVAGFIALGLVVFAAAVGSNLQSWINMNVLRLFGGIAIMTIGISIIGLKIPDNVPLYIIMTGFAIGMLVKWL